jgi:ABC-type glycerol-3-phosphate transport system permease component
MKRKHAFKVVKYVLLIFFAILFIAPLYLSLVNAINHQNALPTVVPAAWDWFNFAQATTIIPFWRFTLNSLIISGIFVSLSTISSAMSGYAFARLKAPGSGPLFMLVLATMMVPGIITQIPQYILFHKYGLLYTFWPWFLWGLGGSAFYIFMYRQFFLSIPVEIEEAARIDGCSIFYTFWRIIIPMSPAVIATVVILQFQGSWNDVTGPFMFLKDTQYPLATALTMIGYKPNNAKVDIPQLALAGGLLLSIPTIVTFFIGQRQIVEGIVTTGLKG